MARQLCPASAASPHNPWQQAIISPSQRRRTEVQRKDRPCQSSQSHSIIQHVFSRHLLTTCQAPPGAQRYSAEQGRPRIQICTCLTPFRVGTRSIFVKRMNSFKGFVPRLFLCCWLEFRAKGRGRNITSLLGHSVHQLSCPRDWMLLREPGLHPTAPVSIPTAAHIRQPTEGVC